MCYLTILSFEALTNWTQGLWEFKTDADIVSNCFNFGNAIVIICQHIIEDLWFRHGIGLEEFGERPAWMAKKVYKPSKYI